MGIIEKLMSIQTKIKAPKNLYNKFGKYYYRNAEGICEAVKPYLDDNKCALKLDDEIVEVAGRVYVRATATLIDCESLEDINAVAYAREGEGKNGMDASQVTGSTSSYARKYALNALFLLDDTKDDDSEENHIEKEAKKELEPKNADTLPKSEEDCSKPCTKEQLKKMQELVNQAESPTDKQRQILGYYKASNFRELTQAQAQVIINTLSKDKKELT
ncbi:MAG: ERF family protein [Prevotellaceae bacterium]|nr:ERF family protein [Candidatus Faecinaster equi]